MGFLLTVVMRVLLGPVATKVSRKGRASSWFGSSMVNYICGSCEVLCCNNYWLCFASWMKKSHPHTLAIDRVDMGQGSGP